jgi:hypothetical protein
MRGLRGGNVIPRGMGRRKRLKDSIASQGVERPSGERPAGWRLPA